MLYCETKKDRKNHRKIRNTTLLCEGAMSSLIASSHFCSFGYSSHRPVRAYTSHPDYVIEYWAPSLDPRLAASDARFVRRVKIFLLPIPILFRKN